MTVLKGNLDRHPGDLDTLMALVDLSRETGDFGAALDYTGRLSRLLPGDRNLAALIEKLKGQIKGAGEDAAGAASNSRR